VRRHSQLTDGGALSLLGERSGEKEEFADASLRAEKGKVKEWNCFDRA
jgi:hypothetical protein